MEVVWQKIRGAPSNGECGQEYMYILSYLECIFTRMSQNGGQWHDIGRDGLATYPCWTRWNRRVEPSRSKRQRARSIGRYVRAKTSKKVGHPLWCMTFRITNLDVSRSSRSPRAVIIGRGRGLCSIYTNGCQIHAAASTAVIGDTIEYPAWAYPNCPPIWVSQPLSMALGHWST